MTQRPKDWLPSELPTPARARHVVLIVALAVASTLGLNALAGEALEELTTNRGYWLVHQKWDLLDSLDEPVDWLILGDSSCNQGVRPDVFEARLGESAVNLCTVGDLLAVNDAWMLERYIEDYGPPKHVVIVHVYDIWYRDARFLNRQPLLAKIPLPWDFWEDLEPEVSLDSSQENKLFVARYLPLWSENKTLSSWLHHPSVVLDRDFEITDDGFMGLDAPNPKNVRKDAREHFHFTRTQRFSLSPINRDALERMGELSDRHGFDLWVASGPLWEGVWGDPHFRRYFDAAMRGLSEVAADFDHMRVVLRDPVRFPDGDMENVDHLTEDAAAVYTERLIDAVHPGR